MRICRNCRQLFDPTVQPREGDVFANDYLCSFHPGEAKQEGNTGPRYDYADVYAWTCCSMTKPGAVINGRDYPPRRSPGCTKGPHVVDESLVLDPRLAEELVSLQQRLRDIEARETLPRRDSQVFVSYAHADADFVEGLTRRFAADKIEYWCDAKDLLVGEVIDEAISRGIQANALFLVVLTPTSINSSWVSRELDEAAHEAAEGRKVILPVLAKGLAASCMPARIRRFRCADFNEDALRGYELLLASMREHARRGLGIGNREDS
jgi:hypothetical protein